MFFSPIGLGAQTPNRLQFVTRGQDGSILPQEFTFDSVPCPRIVATIDDFNLADDGSVSVLVSGSVTDEASDIVADPAQQLQNIEVRLEDATLATLSLSNTGEPELPWRPYRFRATFSTRVDFTPDGLGSVRLNLTSSQNVAGCSATATFYVNTIVPGSTEITAQADSAPGTFFPTMLRIYVPTDVLPPDTHIFAMGLYWNIDRKNFGDGEYWYAVDGKDNPVIFLPATFAEPYMQVQTLEDEFAAAVVYAAAAVGPAAKIPVETGLLVLNDDITMPEDENLLKTITKYEKDQFKLGADTVYIYGPEKGKALLDVGHSDNTLDTEIKWRYVGTKDTIAFFRGRKPFVTDVTHREGVVEAARNVFFTFNGNLMFNPTFWEKPDLVKEGKTAFNAVEDIFETQSKYQMACLHAATYSFLRGASQAIGADAFNTLMERKTFDNSDRLRIRMHAPNLTKGQVDNNNPNNANWIPGDWGYISNVDSEENLRKQHGKAWELYVGENVIYLGGEKAGDGNFTTRLNCKAFDDNCFLQSAYFFGLIRGARNRTFASWIKEVSTYSTNAKPVIESYRDRLRQPQASGSAVFTDLTLTPGQYAGGTLTITGNDFKILTNTDSTILTVTEATVPVIVDTDMKLQKIGHFGYLSMAQDTGTTLLGTLDFTMTNNEFQNNKSRVFVASEFYDIESNSSSMIVTKKTVSAPFKIVDKDGGNGQEGKVQKLAATN
jgi:hypothetical protein